MHCKILSLTPDVNNLHDYSSLLQYPNHQLLPTGDLPVQREPSTALQMCNLKKQRHTLFSNDVRCSSGTQRDHIPRANEMQTFSPEEVSYKKDVRAYAPESKWLFLG